jgi:hypothetical protein
MSPEQARAQAIDGRSDIYSLGVVAYQCLTGTVPYDGEDSFSIGYKHITESIPTPQLITADERRLFEVIKRMLMKDPADRFQSCEELVASLQGQPTAAPGAVRASVAAAAAGGGHGRTPNSPISGGPPLIVSQPTTPLDSPLVNRRRALGRDEPRRIADRSPAMRGSGSWGWFWIVLAVLGVAGGGYYYYSSKGFAPGQAAAADSAATPADSAPASLPSQTEPIPPPSDPASSSPAPPLSAPLQPARPAASEAPTPDSVPVDSGGIRLVGLPRGSAVLIDEKPVTDPMTRLAPGPHAIAISAPRFNFYSDTVIVRPGQIQEITPQLTAIGAPVRERLRERREGAARCAPGPGYNADGSCFDERPKPVSPPFVPLPPEVTGSPRPSLLWVKVSAEGRTVDMQRLRASDNVEFERAVRNFVWTVTWHPALKNGAPVEAWTQMLFPPQPP